MMFGASFQPYFSLYQFPTGRRLFALHEVAERARQRGLSDLLGQIEAAIEQCQQTAALEAGWRRSRATTEGKRVLAAQIDSQVDRVLGAISSHLGTLIHAFGDEGLGGRAKAVLTRIFPEGAGAITRLSYENELSAATVIHEDLSGPLGPEAEALHLGVYVEHLGRLLPDYRAALSREATREVSFDRIREARGRDQDALLKVMATILVMFMDDDQVETRAHLLAPILSQQRRLKEGYTNRRALPDVDPQTGEERVPGDEDESVDPPPAGDDDDASADPLPE